MKERRLERRMLCADLVEICWWDQTGAVHTVIANIEDISTQGASVILDIALSAGAEVRIRCLRGEFTGAVSYCRHEPDFGYVAGIEFTGGSRWNRRKYRPRHLLDPLALARHTTRGNLSI
jgi:hypothetical protein